MPIAATDLMPVSTLLERAGVGLRYFHTLATAGKAPAIVTGVPRALARSWLDSRGVATALPPGELIRASRLCELAGIAPTNYYVAVRKGNAPRQLKGVLKSEAAAWLRARADEAAAEAQQRLRAAQAAEQEA